MTQSEQARLQVLHSLPAEQTAEQTAILMGVCRRHTRRILAAYRQNGATALVFAPRVGTGPSSSGATQFTRAMDELGVELILPRALHAKGRVESQAGTFQDRLVTELRVAGTSSTGDANRLLRDFLPRFNDHSKVPDRHQQAANRTLDPTIQVDKVLFLKHVRKVHRDDALKYRRYTRQLLPDEQRASYA